MSAVNIYVSPEVAATRALYAPFLGNIDPTSTIRDRLADQADILFDAHRAGDPAVFMQIASWHPKLVGEKAQAILAHPFSADDARLTLAREYGYQDWNDVEKNGAQPPNETFEQAVDIALAGDLDGLRALLASAPALARQRSDYAHRASLLHYMAANGVESWRQVTPNNADVIVAALIGAGAEVNASATMYGGARPLGLLLTSAHPRAAGLTDRMAAQLSAAGAN